MSYTTKRFENGVEILYTTMHPTLVNYATNQPEKEVFSFIDTLTTNDIFIDLGAAEGRFALYAAKKGIPTCAVEPEKLNFLALEKNREINKLDNLRIFQFAIGVQDHKSKMKIGQPFPGGHQKVLQTAQGRSDLDFNFTASQEVQVYSFASFIKNENLIPTAIKIDIDGSELDFFAGAKDSLSSVKQIMIELYKGDKSYQQIQLLLAAAGFTQKAEYQIPNEKQLFNIWFIRR